MIHNTQTLNELLRAIDFGQGEFSLLLIRCNYGQLRDRVWSQLQAEIPGLSALTLKDTDATLYSLIQHHLGETMPTGLAVFGLEQLAALDTALTTANNMRESFRQDFPCPLLLWLDDAVFTQVQRQMPDFKSWATTTFRFDLDTAELEQLLQAKCDRYLEAIVARDVLIPEFGLLSKTDLRESQLAEAELFKRDVILAPEIEGAIALAEGSLLFAEPDQSDAVLHQFQTSLAHWREAESLLGQAIAQFYSSHCYAQQGEWETAQATRAAGLADFQAAGRSDLVTRFGNQMGEIWVELEDWDALRAALPGWQQAHGSMPRLLARDMSLAAQLAEQQQDWPEMERCADRAIALLAEQEQAPPLVYSVQRATAIAAQGNLGGAIAGLAATRAAVEPEHDPVGYVALLAKLRQLYFDHGQYREAFAIKQERRVVQFLFKLRAFLGAGRLQAWQAGSQSLALGREADIHTLVTERVGADRNSLTVLCGMSGVGKSSLVEAGLIPALRGKIYFQKYRVLTVLVRVYSHWVVDLGQALQGALRAAYPEILLPEPLETVAALKAQLQHNASRNLLTVLIFDQFEEFFFVCKEPEARREFYRFLADCLERKAIQYSTVILSLREDYIHELFEFENYLHGLVAAGEVSSSLERDFLGREQRQRIENFTAEVARQVMGQLCEASAFRMEAGLIAAVVADLTNALGRVRPVELQVVGAQLEALNITTVDAYRALGENPKLALAEEWVEAIVTDCGPALRGAVWKLLMALTNEKGTRPLLTLGELATELANFGKVSVLPEVELEADILEILVGSGLVVRWPQEPEDRFQLVHDYLVDVVRRRYNRDYQRQFEDLLAQQKEYESVVETWTKVQQVLLWGTSIASVILAGMAGLTGWSAYGSNRAEQRAKVNELIAQSAWLQERVANEWGTLLAVETYNMIQESKPKNVRLSALDTVLREGLPNLPTTVSTVQHRYPVWSASFSPDGKYILTGSSDNTAGLLGSRFKMYKSIQFPRFSIAVTLQIT